jgi:hypothetical protein
MARHTGPQDSKCSFFFQRKDDRSSAKEVKDEGESVLQAGRSARPGFHTSGANFMSPWRR